MCNKRSLAKNKHMDFIVEELEDWITGEEKYGGQPEGMEQHTEGYSMGYRDCIKDLKKWIRHHEQ